MIRFSDPSGNVLEVFHGVASNTAVVSPYGHTFVTGDQGTGHVVLTCSDDAEALHFYRDILGFYPGTPCGCRHNWSGVRRRSAGLADSSAANFGTTAWRSLPLPTPSGIVHLMMKSRVAMTPVSSDRALRRKVLMSATHAVGTTRCCPLHEDGGFDVGTWLRGKPVENDDWIAGSTAVSLWGRLHGRIARASRANVTGEPIDPRTFRHVRSVLHRDHHHHHTVHGASRPDSPVSPSPRCHWSHRWCCSALRRSRAPGRPSRGER